jgi:hypothetical protein
VRTVALPTVEVGTVVAVEVETVVLGTVRAGATTVHVLAGWPVGNDEAG